MDASSPQSQRRRVRPRLGVRGWIRRVVLLAFIAVTLWLAYDRLGGRLRLQWEILGSQKACLAYRDPPGRLLYDGDAKAANAHLREGGYETVVWWRNEDAGPSDPRWPWAVALAEPQRRVDRLKTAREERDRWEKLGEMPNDPYRPFSAGGGGL